MDAANLVAELKRRRVFRALVGYGLAAFAVLQVIEPVMHGLQWPDLVLRYVVLAIAAGFPVVVGLAWLFDLRAGRIERTPPSARPTMRGPRLALALAGIGALAAAPAVTWYFVRGGAQRTPPAAPMASIAVLPFTDLSPAKDQGYFSDGIAEEILDSLAQVEGLRVAGRTSSFSFSGKSDDLRAIGQKLDVANILEGSVRKEGNRVRVTAQLVSAADGFHLWSKTFERELTGIFAVQDEIGKEVVQALRLKLLGSSSPQPARPTSDKAYVEYLRGKQLVRSDAPLGLAIAAYEKSIALDPTYAPAWAELATRTAFAVEHDLAGSGRAREKALAAAEKAVALAPALADSYEARGLVRMDLLWDWEGAKADIDRALSLAPGSNDAWRRQSQLLTVLGRTTEAAASIRKAIDLDPLAWGNWQWLGQVLFLRSEFPAARAAFQRAMELDSSEQGRLSYTEAIAGCYLYEGNLVETQRWSVKLPTEADRLSFKVALEFSRGDADRSKRDLDTLAAKTRGAHPYLIALLHAWRGERDLALDWLDKAYATPHAELPMLKTDPGLRSLRTHPRFVALLKAMKLPAD